MSTLKIFMKEKNEKELFEKLNSIQERIAASELQETKKVKIEEEYENSQLILNSIINTIPDIIYRLDADGKIIFINDVVKNYNYEPEDLIGKNIFELVHPDDREKARYRVNERRTGDRRTKSFEVRLLTLEKKPIPFEIRSKEIYKEPVFLVQAEGLYSNNKVHSNTFLGTQGLARDISEKKRMEEQLRQTQKMETIGLLAGGIAHDFNNLITVILGYADNLLDNLQTGDSIYNKIKHIQKSAKSAEALTTQLLAFSRRQILKPKVLNLNDIVHKMEVVLKRVIKENVKLKINLDENLDNIKTDPVQLEQIIMNLAINGSDAMPDGGRLIISTKNVFLDEEFTKKLQGSKTGYFVCLSITDTGIGMDKEVLENIFEPFYTTKELGRGTGLGLATVYGIIKQSGGNIWVDSERGNGTTFDIFLPKCEEMVTDTKKSILPEEKLGGKETILVVEDQKDVRELVAGFLKEFGYNIIEAIDGEDAIKQSKNYNDQIHVLLTDVVMPNMNGKEVANRLVAEHPDLKVIFMSGYADNTIAKMGVMDIDKVFIQKPFSPIDLMYKIRKLLVNN